MIEGYVPTSKDRVVVIDDVLTRGTNIEHITKVLEPTGAEVTEAIVVLKRGNPRLDIHYHYLVTSADLLKKNAGARIRT